MVGSICASDSRKQFASTVHSETRCRGRMSATTQLDSRRSREAEHSVQGTICVKTAHACTACSRSENGQTGDPSRGNRQFLPFASWKLMRAGTTSSLLTRPRISSLHPCDPLWSKQDIPRAAESETFNRNANGVRAIYVLRLPAIRVDGRRRHRIGSGSVQQQKNQHVWRRTCFARVFSHDVGVGAKRRSVSLLPAPLHGLSRLR